MNSNDMVLFRQALTEAAIQKYTDELAQCDTDDTVSARHTRIMKRILKNAGTVSAELGKRWSNKKRMVAVLVAAILMLLGGLTVYAKRDAIVTFVKQIFEKFTTILYQEEPSQEASVPDSIEHTYQPAYIPDGFELQNTDLGLTTYQMQWVNSGGITIVFDQGVIGTNYDMDNEHGSFETLRTGEYDVFCYHGLGNHIYVWSDESYSYSITVYHAENPPLRFDEIEKIILSLEKAE